MLNVYPTSNEMFFVKCSSAFSILSHIEHFPCNRILEPDDLSVTNLECVFLLFDIKGSKDQKDSKALNHQQQVETSLMLFFSAMHATLSVMISEQT